MINNVAVTKKRKEGSQSATSNCDMIPSKGSIPVLLLEGKEIKKSLS